MKIGVRVPCYRRWCRRVEARDIAQTVEALGFDSLWVQDHLVAPIGDAPDTVVLGLDDWMTASPDRGSRRSEAVTLEQYYAGDDWWLDPFALWGFLAGVTERVRLASDIVVVPYRNPIVQAKMIGTLDVLSGGRMLIGTGSGHVRAEADALGTSFDDRADVHDEYLRILKAVLSGGEASFSGDHYRFGPLRTLIRCEQVPHPPIYVGGNGRRAIRRAAELGDGWLPSLDDPDGLRKGIAALDVQCAAIGREQRPAIALSLPSAFRFPIGGATTSSRRTTTPAEVVQRLSEYERIGVDHASLAFAMPSAEVYLDQIETFAREVLPAFHRDAPTRASG